LSQHDGSNNAYTEQEKTVFFNEISHAGFNEGMDRFAQFFIEPLFQKEMVGRELDAVNSEHMKNVPNQGRRLWELMRSTAKNTSVLSHFYTGTTESLGHGDNKTVAALRKYHSKNYCAPRMNLVMVSNRTLDDQIAVAHKHFDAVPRGECSPTPRDFGGDKSFADAATRGNLIEFHTDSAPQLQFMWPMQPTLKNYKAQPSSMLSYVLGYAGPKSLKSELKARDLASDLGLQVDQSSAGTVVFLTLDLTPSGLKDVKGTTEVVFDYLQRVRTSAKEDLKTVYPSMQKMMAVTFDYMEQPDSVMDAVSGLAADSMSYDAADVLTGGTNIDQMDAVLVEDLTMQLSPDNVNLAMATKDFDEKRANRFNKYYKVHYAQNPIPESIRGSWGKAIAGDNLKPPPALKYVPTNLAVLDASAGEIPKHAASKSGEEVWWLGRGLFPLPKAQLRVKLSVPTELFATAEYAVLRKLHVEMANRFLEEPMEDYGNCGLNWQLKEVGSGYAMELDGYNEHISALVAQVTEGFANPDQHDAKRFEQVKQRIMDDLEDATSKMPYAHAAEALSAISTNSVFGRDELLKSLKATGSTRFAAYLDELKASGVRVQMLATGNLEEATAQDLGETLTKKLAFKKILKKAEAARTKALVADGENIEVRMKNPIPGDNNSATINMYQYGIPDVSQRVKLLMLGQMIANPVYDELRTKEQLGYVVFGGVMQHVGVLELRVIVQGAKQGPDYVDGRIESVLDSFDQKLKNQTAAEFSRWKASLRSSINREDQNMAQEADRIWAHVDSDELCFNRKQMALDFLDTLNSPEEIAAEYKVFRQNPKKISVRLFGANDAMNPTNNTLTTGKTAKAAESFLVVSGDWTSDKAAVAKTRSFYPNDNVCQIHRSK